MVRFLVFLEFVFSSCDNVVVVVIQNLVTFFFSICKTGARVFVFPMPGTSCRREEGLAAMAALQQHFETTEQQLTHI